MEQYRDTDGFERNKTIYNYENTPEEACELTQKLLGEYAEYIPEGSDTVIIMVRGASDYANIGRYIEETVFMESFENDPEEMQREYGPYEDESIFFLALDCEDNRPIATVRVIENGHKTLVDATKEPFAVDAEDVVLSHYITDVSKVWDIGTAAKMSEYAMDRKKALVVVELYRAMYAASLNSGIEHWVTIVDDELFNMTRNRFGIPFVPLGDSEPGPYLGSDMSHAVYAHVPDFREKMGEYMSNVKGRFAQSILDILVKGSDDDKIFLG